MVRANIIRLIIVAFIFSASISDAAINSYVIDGEGSVYKLYLNEFESTPVAKLDKIFNIDTSAKNNIVIDYDNNNIYVESVDSQWMARWIEVFDLHSFEYKAKVSDIVSFRPIGILVNRSKKTIYINWWKQEYLSPTGEQHLTILNSVNFVPVKEIEMIKRTDEISISNDGERLFMFYAGKPDFYFSIYNTSTMTLIKDVDLKTSLSGNVFGWDVDTYMDNKLLLSENRKTNFRDSSNYVFYKYNIDQNSYSSKLITGKGGEIYLFSNENIMAFMESRLLEGTRRYIMTGNIYFYDLSNSKQVANASYETKKYNHLLGQTQDGKYLLFYSHDGGSSKAAVHVIDLATYKNVGSIEIGQNAPVFLFYKEEPDEAPAQ